MLFHYVCHIQHCMFHNEKLKLRPEKQYFIRFRTLLSYEKNKISLPAPPAGLFGPQAMLHAREINTRAKSTL